MSGVLVVAETRKGEVRDISYELITAARALAEQGGGPVRVLVVDGDPSAVAGGLGAEGVEEVLTVTSPRAEFEPHLQAEAVSAAIAALEPAVVLTGHTVDAMGYAPAVAAKLGLGFASDAFGVAIEDGAPAVRRGAYGDRLVASLAFPGKGTTLVMLRAGAYEAAAPGGDGDGAATVRDAGIALDASAARTEHLGYREAEAGDVDITKAPFLLSIGRGVEDEDGVSELEQIADRLHATLSVSRPLVDSGLAASSRQVGQSGLTVKPKVYLALGISGAVQHLAGMRKADTIIAINTDPEAPIFQVAHYGAVADLFDVARALPGHFA
ncbi:MAG TPA: electron transfer flavoprotein subunit alpha/FixB family protein [Baekduia sp.]|uniref:electron transfer flavoprotein subunit alpha/FixB family protein n=1 Tax=Baekduia sp. TaxID=2600305 RepID=UPI002D76802A|nr:electron transfer flavoprotein subunit alpha/FixB family protein [Baekduia sp.]HET6506987.1 electron transfer flavoprotein subunit alpha/FixB family protein [Baekduia sp.]